MTIAIMIIIGIFIFGAACEGLGALIGIGVGIFRAINEEIEEKKKEREGTK